MSKTLATFTIALFGFGAAAQAATISDSDTYSFALSSEGTDQTLEIDQFDDQGGTRILQSVTLELNGTISGDVSVTNDSSEVHDITAKLNGALRGRIPYPDDDIELLLYGAEFGGMLDEEEVDSATANDVDPNETVDFGTLTSGSNSETESITSGFSGFIGTGTLDLLVDGLGNATFSSGGDASVSLSDFRAAGEATVTYEHTVIPSPATLPAGLMLVGMIAARRPRRQRA